MKKELTELDREFRELTELLNKGQERLYEVDLAVLARQMIFLYQRIIDHVKTETKTPSVNQSIVITTYVGDLKLALHEVISNSLYALEHSRTPPAGRLLEIRLGNVPGRIVVSVGA